MKRAMKLTLPTLGAFAAFDAAKVMVQAALLSYARRAYPALFDGTLAAEQVRLALRDGIAAERRSTRSARSFSAAARTGTAT